MRKNASILALVFGAFLLISSLYMYQNDANLAGQRISDGFQSLHVGNQSTFDHQMAEQDSRSDEEKILAVVGVVFLIAGFAMYKRDPIPVTA
jgi:hypothetical protein